LCKNWDKYWQDPSIEDVGNPQVRLLKRHERARDEKGGIECHLHSASDAPRHAPGLEGGAKILEGTGWTLEA
jgi:hypothetical protein